MKIEDNIKLAMARMIENDEYNRYTNVVVSDWDEEFDRGGFGGCSTCGFGGTEFGGTEDEYTVTIYFTSDQTDRGNYRYSGSFADLIRELGANG